LLDRFGRDVTELRMSVTPRCNLSCFYCHKEWDPSKAEVSKEEILETVRVAKSFGVKRLKITGGEPLLREDLPDIVRETSGLLEEVSMTTNGTNLSGLWGELRRAGLSRVNVNLPTLVREKYSKICGADLLDKVLEGIDTVAISGARPVKVNMVLLKGVNENEVERMIEFCSSVPSILQLIELQPIPDDKDTFDRYHLDLTQVESWIGSIASGVEATRNGQRNRYLVEHNGCRSAVEIVRPNENPSFCSACSRLRVTSDGRLKPCLLRSDNLVDFVQLMKRGADGRELARQFRMALAKREPYWR